MVGVCHQEQVNNRSDISLSSRLSLCSQCVSGACKDLSIQEDSAKLVRNVLRKKVSQ